MGLFSRKKAEKDLKSSNEKNKQSLNKLKADDFMNIAGGVIPFTNEDLEAKISTDNSTNTK